MQQQCVDLVRHEPDGVRERFLAAARTEYGERYGELTFEESGALEVAQARRDELWCALAAAGRVGCSGTKADVTTLSPGCQRCTAGLWSCLFVNSICNASCAYCPAPQTQTGVAGTNLLDFRNPAEYAEYVERLGITGVSLSGGEPLLTLERTLRYLTAVKRRLGDRVHAWLYTNGMLATTETITRLRDAGLDEIRFDIGAIDYDLGPVSRAVGAVPTVTVEIPLLPERRDQIRALVPSLRERGVGFLNLHQLRVTPHNLARLSGRGYRMTHGEKVTVIDSELAALELLADVRSSGDDFPINYCSSAYKLRYQRMGHRRRAAALIAGEGEIVTGSGFLRSAVGDGEPLQPAKYIEAVLREAPTYRFAFDEVVLSTGRSLVIERRPADPDLVADGRVEAIASGLPEYF